MKKFLSLILFFGVLFGIFPKNTFAENRIYEIEKKISGYKDEIEFFEIYNNDYYIVFKDKEKYNKAENKEHYNCECFYLTKNGEKILENINYTYMFFYNGNYYIFVNHQDNTFIKNGEKVTINYPGRYGYSHMPSQIFIDNYNLQIKENGIYKDGKLIINTNSIPNIISVIGNDIYYTLDIPRLLYSNLDLENDWGIYKNNEETNLSGLERIFELENGEKIYMIGGKFYKNGKFLDKRIHVPTIIGNDIYTFLKKDDTYFVKKNGTFYNNEDSEDLDLENDIIFKVKWDNIQFTREYLTVNSKGDIYLLVYSNDLGEKIILKNGKLLSDSIKGYEEKLRIKGSAPNLEDLVLKNDDRVKFLDYFETKNLENKENLGLNSEIEKTEIKSEEEKFEKKEEKTKDKKEEIKYLEEFYFDKEVPEKIEEEKTEISEKFSENEEKSETKMNNLKITRLPKTGPLEIFLIIFSLILTFGIFKRKN